MHNTEKVPSFVTANLLTSHFTTYRFAVQIAAKVVIPMQFLPRNKAVTIQTSKCGFDVLEQCVPEIGL